MNGIKVQREKEIEIEGDKQLIKKIKEQLRERNRNIQEKQEEIKELKKHIKYTNIREMEIENKQQKDELNRLTNRLRNVEAKVGDHTISDMENTIYRLNSRLEMQQEDNKKLSQLVRGFEQEI